MFATPVWMRPPRGCIRWYGTIDMSPVPESQLSPSPPLHAPPERQWLGPTLALAGAFGFSAKAIFAKLAYAASTVDALTVLTFRLIFSLPFVALMIWLTTEAIRLMGAKRVALIETIGPVLTIGLGALFLGEAITVVQVAGAALVMAGVVLVTLKK